MPSSLATGPVTTRLHPVRRQALRAVAGTLVCLVSLAAPWTARSMTLPDFADIVEKVGPAVVNLRINDRSGAARGEGSGFILSADGYVMTNAHVVSGAAEVLVTLIDKREFKAKVVGSDRRTDVALLKLDATGLPFLPVGDAKRVRVGEWVLAIGSPLGYTNTVTAGIISAKQRETGSLVPLLQTDLAVSMGSSGCPLINTRGEAVGIVNSQILLRSSAEPGGSSTGISFAIPIDEAMNVVDQLKASGRVVRGYLGILPIDVPDEVADELGLGKGKGRGAYLSQVIKGGPGDKAGLLTSDVVTALNGKVVENALELRRGLASVKPGTAVTLRVNRRGKVSEVKATLAEMPSQASDLSPPEAEASSVEPKGATGASLRPWGLTVAALTESERQAAGPVGGVKVVGVAGPAAAVGVRAGDVVLAVAGADVADVKQFDAAVAKANKGKPLPVTLLRGQWQQAVHIPPTK